MHYNETLLTTKDIEGILEKYKNNDTLRAILSEYKISSKRLKKILIQYNIPQRERLNKNKVRISGLSKRFYNLVVTEEISVRKGQYNWKVKCDCGKEVIHQSCVITAGLVRCCGRDCEFFIPRKISGYKGISGRKWRTIKGSAEKRGREFSISIEFAWNLFEKQNRKCAISGVDLEFNQDYKKETASLDRINSNLDYIEENVQWLHQDVNLMKQSMTDSDLIKWCKIIAKFQNSC